jgi:hypothetical protein
MRDLKEALFVEGRAGFRHDGRMLSVSMRDLERDADFRAFAKSIAQAYAQGVALAGEDARRRGASQVRAVAVGGGAAAPFIQNLIQAKPRNAKVRVTPLPATPTWAFTDEFKGNLAPVFPQLSIAIGGALAPETMLFIRG